MTRPNEANPDGRAISFRQDPKIEPSTPGELEFLIELGRIFTSPKEPNQVFSEFAEFVSEVIPWDRIVTTALPSGEHVGPNFHQMGQKIDGFDGNQRPFVPYELVELLERFRRPVIIDDSISFQSEDLGELRELADAAGLKSWMAVPVEWSGDVIAAIHFRSKKQNAYGGDHLDLAQKIADQIAGAIAGQITVAELQRESRQREWLADISRVASSSDSIEDVFSPLAQLVGQLIPIDRMGLTILENEEHVPVGLLSHGIGLPDLTPNALPPSRGQITALLRQLKKPTILDPTSPDAPEDVVDTAKIAEKSGLVSWLAAPLFWGDRHVGNLHFRSTQPNVYTDREVDLAVAVAQQLSGAVANWLSLKQAERESHVRGVLSQLGREITASTSLSDSFAAFAKLASELVPLDRLSISLNSTKSSKPKILASYGTEIPPVDTESRFKVRGDVSRLLAGDPSTMIVSDAMVNEHQDVKTMVEAAASAGLHSWLVAPLVWQGRLIGMLHFRSSEQDAYSSEHLDLATQIASQISGSVSNTIAYNDLETEAHVRTVLADIGRTTGSSNNLERLLPEIERLTREVVDFDGFSIGSYSDTDKTVRRLYARGAFADANGYVSPSSPLATAFPLSESAAGTVLVNRTAEIICVNSVDELEGYPQSLSAFESGTRSFLTVPLVFNDLVVGALQLRSFKEDAYVDADLAIVTRLADYIAGALANSIANEQVQLQAAALEAADQAIVITSPTGIIEWTNGAFTELTGWKSSEIFGLHTSVLKSHDSNNWHQDEEIWEALNSGKSWSGEHINRKKDGTEFTEDLTVTPVVGSDGETTHIIGIKKDVTDRLRAEEERKNTAKIESENRELQRIAAARSEFLSTVSHELRTPLTTVSAFADILYNSRSENLTDRQRTHLTLIRKSSTQLSSLINDLLDISQADSGRLALEKSDFEVRPMVEEIRDASGVLLATRDQVLSATIDVQSGVSINADRTRIIQVVTNLLSNASKYSPEGSNISLSAAIQNNQLAISVTDSGTGISKSDQRMMFSPFFRGSNNREFAPDGRGLGLAVVHSIVDLHDGTITVDSKYRKGTSITVSIPGVTSEPQSD